MQLLKMQKAKKENPWHRPITTFLSYVLLLLRYLVMLIVNIIKVLLGFRIRRNEFLYLFMLPKIKESILHDAEVVSIYEKHKVVPSTAIILMSPMTYELAVPEVIAFTKILVEKLSFIERYYPSYFPDIIPEVKLPLTSRSLLLAIGLASNISMKYATLGFDLLLYFQMLAIRLSEAALRGRPELFRSFLLDFGDEGKRLLKEYSSSFSGMPNCDLIYKVSKIAIQKMQEQHE